MRPRIAVPPFIDPTVLEGWRGDALLADLGGETMGTSWSVRMAVPPGFDTGTVAAAIAVRLEGLLAQMSHWREDSVLGRFNRAAAGSWFTLPPDFARVIEAAVAVAMRSGSAFDPTIGQLVNMWGFGPVARDTSPTVDDIAAASSRSGWRHLAYDRATCRLRQPGGLHLDLSGIAKGYAVDAVAQVVRDHGCLHALVEIGGELAGSGMRPDGDPWWVDLENPAGAVPPLRIALHQLAAATSGDYVRGGHTIDPRTGRPVQHAMAVSVLHRSAMFADAWATALSVVQPEDMSEIAAAENLAVRALIRTGSGLREWVSQALSDMVCDADADAG